MDENTNPAVANNGPSGDELLRKLALALLAPRYSGESHAEPQLLVGQLPPNLGFDVPLPEGAHLLGTLLGGDPTIALEAALAPEEVVEFYRAALTAGGLAGGGQPRLRPWGIRAYEPQSHGDGDVRSRRGRPVAASHVLRGA